MIFSISLILLKLLIDQLHLSQSLCSLNIPLDGLDQSLVLVQQPYRFLDVEVLDVPLILISQQSHEVPQSDQSLTGTKDAKTSKIVALVNCLSLDPVQR